MLWINKVNCKEFQGELGYGYERAKRFAELHPEVFAEREKLIQEQPYYTTEEDAIKAARDLERKARTPVQIWAKVGKDEEFYYIDDYFVVTDDNFVKQAADYIGMAHVFEL